MTLRGNKQHDIYSSERYHVYSFTIEGQKGNVKVISRRPINTNLVVCLYGEWDSKAEQFISADYSYSVETDRDLYLLLSYEITESNAQLAEKLMKTFGGEVRTKLTQPEVIKKFFFLGGGERARRLCESYKAKTARNVAKINLVTQYGFSQEVANKITNLASEEEINRIVSSNIYKLCAKPFSISLRTIEKIALKIQQGLDSIERLRWHAVTVLEAAEFAGHLYLGKEDFVSKLNVSINNGFEQPVYTEDAIVTILQQLFEEGNTIKLLVGRVYLARTDKGEKLFAANIVQRLQTPSTANEELVQKAIKSYESFESIKFSEGQKQAIKLAVQNQVTIVTGGPGTGKTTVVKGIIAVMRKIYGYEEKDFKLMAPTGKAAKRMSDSTGYDASTIHSAIQLGVEETEENAEQTLTEKVIIIDESSMLDQKVSYALIKSIPLDAKVVFVGDVDQLESIGAGDVFTGMIKSGVIPVAELSVIYRQEETSAIVTNALKIKTGDANLVFDNSFSFVLVKDETDAVEKIVEAYVKDAAKFGAENIALLCPRRKNAEVSVQSLNPLLQKAVNKNINSVVVDEETFIVGDRVMQTRNTKWIPNGEIGVIVAIYKQLVDNDNSVYRFKIDFSGNIVEYDETDMRNIELAYTTTVHKSQGSEYQHVIIPLLSSQYNMLKRNIFYTAVTRAKKSVRLIGQKTALVKAIQSCDRQERNTLLADRLVSYTKRIKNK